MKSLALHREVEAAENAGGELEFCAASQFGHSLPLDEISSKT
jgi:hypothetical protein